MQETAVNRMVALLLLQQKGEISGIEQQELDSWANMSQANRQFIDRCMNEAITAHDINALNKVEEDLAWQRFLEKNDLQPTKVVPMRKKMWVWMVAAVLMGAVVTGTYLFWPRHTTPVREPKQLVSKVQDLPPGGNKATLTLGDGRKIILNDAKDGVLAKEDGAAVNKQGDALYYDPETESKARGAVLYHAVTTPIGGFYSLSLPDKTKVWLNADSRIKYPTAFVGNERKVEVAGEAYFEVTKDATKAFIVSTGNTTIKVLGTHFNVRNYSDESASKTTLLEGRVLVTVGEKLGTEGTVLSPGQQATVQATAQAGETAQVRTVEVDAVVAWKNGYFEFRAAPLSEVIKEIRRWYVGIESVKMEAPIDDKFTAAMPRNLPLSTILAILQETNKVHFAIRNNTIVITK